MPSDFEKTDFIAQEVKEVIPKAVSVRKDDYLELNVDPIHGAVVNAIKELSKSGSMRPPRSTGNSLPLKKKTRKGPRDSSL